MIRTYTLLHSKVSHIENLIDASICPSEKFKGLDSYNGIHISFSVFQ